MGGEVIAEMPALISPTGEPFSNGCARNRACGDMSVWGRRRPPLRNIRGFVCHDQGAATTRRTSGLKMDEWQFTPPPVGCYTPSHHLTAERIKKVLMNRPFLLAETAYEIRVVLTGG